MKKVPKIMEENRGMIESEKFKEQYRKVKSAFTRTRKLSFSMLIVFILQKKEEVKGEHNYAQLSVLYDVINKIVITAECGKAKAYEV